MMVLRVVKVMKTLMETNLIWCSLLHGVSSINHGRI